MKTAKEIVKEYLVKNGFDGLCRDDCGCGVSDFPCCEQGFEDCFPAIRIIPGSRKCKNKIDCGGELLCLNYCFIPAKKGRKRK